MWVASAAVFVIVWLFLQRDREMRAFFVLPRLAETSIAAAAALLSWAIVLAGRHRPGRSWPRIWALTLAAASSLVACLIFALPRRSGMDALAVAAMAAALTLAPRLLRLRPDSLLVQKIAPLSLAGTLLIVMPAAWAAGHEITVSNQERVDQLVRQLREWTSAVREISHYDWPHLESDREGGAGRVQRLAGFKLRGGIDDQAVWQQAVVLRRDRELAETAQALQDALVEALDSARIPRVSSFHEAALHWNTELQRWEANPDFPALSETVGKYHYEVGRLLAELGVADRPVAAAGLAALEEHSRKKRADLERMMTAALQSWSDGWAVFRLPQHSLIGKAELPLSELFEMPFLSEEERSLAAGDLWRLTLLPLKVARRLPSATPSCRRRDEYTARLRGEKQPRTFFRLDCYSYSPQGEGAELRVEMRLVYQSAPGRKYLPGDTLPIEVWFTMPLPADETGERYRQAVMTALSNACRKLCPGDVQGIDLGGSSATGFRIRGEGGTVTVRPTVMSLIGQQKALQVRALRK